MTTVKKKKKLEVEDDRQRKDKVDFSSDVKNDNSDSIFAESKSDYQNSLPEVNGNCIKVKEDDGHRLFPTEIWCMILSYLPKSDLWNLTVVCKALRDIANRYVWERPKFRMCLSPGNLFALKHLPIKHLCTNSLIIRKDITAARNFRAIFDDMPGLQSLSVRSCKPTQDISLEVLEMISPYVTSINTDSIIRSAIDSSTLTSRLMCMNFPRLQSVTLFIGEQRRFPHRRFTAEDLKKLNKLPITKIYMQSLAPQYPRENRITFYPHLALFTQMSFLKEIVLDIWNMNKNQYQTMRDLKERGVVFVNGQWNRKFWRDIFGTNLIE